MQKFNELDRNSNIHFAIYNHKWSIHCIVFGYINILINYKSQKLYLSGKKIINWGRALVNLWIIWKKPLRTVSVPLVINT